MIISKKFLISTLPWVVLIFFCFIVSNKINELTSKKDSQEIIGNQMGSSIVKVEALKPSVAENPELKNKNQDSEEGELPLEWCDPLQYSDLSQHKSILEFDHWLSQFERFQYYNNHNCLDCQIDPSASIFNSPLDRIHRIKSDLINKGKKIAFDRSKILQKIIQGDPRKAIEIAISDERMERLPSEITQHMEKWVSSYADVSTIHICNDPQMPKGQIKHFVLLPNQKKVEVHFYGKRRFLKTTKNLSVWGVYLGEHAAFADESLKVKPIFLDNKQKFKVKLGDIELTIPSKEGLLALRQRVEDAERRAFTHGKVNYPLIASSDGTLNLIDQRYTLVNSLTNWTNAHNLALESNNSLVNINSDFENNIVFTLLRDANAMGLLPVNESNESVQYSWIGATDKEGINGSIYIKDQNLTAPVELNATEGNWRWTDGTDVGSSTYQNWFNNIEPNSSNHTGQDFAAIDFNFSESQNSYWIDLNDSYRLPFIIERPTQPEVTPMASVNGKRKVLVIPGRFPDEGGNYDGSSGNPTDEFGNPLNSGNYNDNFEPDTKENMIRAMEGVKEFYLRNSDGAFELDYVITPTVTMSFPKWGKEQRATPLPEGDENAIPNLFDPTGRFYEQVSFNYTPDPHLDPFGEECILLAAQMSRHYDFEGPAFSGVLSVQINTPPGPFTEAPLVTFVGGNIDATGTSDPDFVSAQGEAIMDGLGFISEIKISELGAFYHTTPNIRLNGVDYNATNFNVNIGRTVVSWVVTTSYEHGAAGVGYVGAPGSYVQAPLSAGVTVHELGHNFGLWHANRHEGEGILPNSDDRSAIDYGNPYAVMGTATGGDIGDFTISSKVFLNETGHFGYTGGNIKDSNEFLSAKVDVADLRDATELNASLLKEVDSKNPNTFRIYRHDYGDAPYALSVGNFHLEIPSSALSQNFFTKLQSGNIFLRIGGPGEGATGIISQGGDLGYTLTITTGGKGYSNEPILTIIDDSNTSLLTINPVWIKRKAGTNYYEPTYIRNLSNVGIRGLRGVEIPASIFSPNGVDARSTMGSYWVSYRRKPSEFGLSVINGTSRSNHTSQSAENIFLDMTPSTQGLVNRSVNPGADFDDAFLMLGKTFSDYQADSHITPIRKGGTEPMEYIEAVVNIGTVASGAAKAPEFTLTVSNNSPFVDETVEFTVIPKDGNFTDYAYSWYINDVGFSEEAYLNTNAIAFKFPQSGYQVVKIIVSDLKGGIVSRNITLNVGEAEKTNLSLVSGNVRSKNGSIQGAKVVLSKAKVIEHSVRVSGNVEDSRINTTHGNPLKFVVDNEENKEIIMHRGEIHRFVFESSTNNYPLSFFKNSDHESAKVKLNGLFTPLVEVAGGGYIGTPFVELNETSRFDSNYSQTITTLDLFRDHQENGTNYHPNGTLITKPSAKILLADTNVTRIIVRPVAIDPMTGVPLNFGGRGMDRDFPPGVQILRSSYWENYNETNATATPYIDGVGTIHQDENGSGYPMVPDIIVFGAGQDANYTGSIRPTDNKKDPVWKVSNVLDRVVTVDQGTGYDPNSTLAVSLYPIEPFAYWSFDEDESLYTDGPLVSTSGFNLPIENGLIAYWKMDEENATTFSGNSFTVEDNSSRGNNLTVSGTGGAVLVNTQRSFWGTRNRSLVFNSTDTFNNNITLDGNFTVSMWLQAIDATYDATFRARGLRVNLNNGNLPWDYATPTISGQLAQDMWTHFSVKFSADSGLMYFYVNGEVNESAGESFVNSDNFFIIEGNYENILIDELMLYNKALSDIQIRYLAGNTYLDISGNKYNAVAMGTGFEMKSAAADTGVAANSFSSDLGNALSFDGSTNFLDLSVHSSDFSSLDGGSVAFWINPNGGSGPIFSASQKDENQSYCRLSLKPNMQLEYQVYEDETLAVDISTKGGSNALKSSTWSHIVMSIGDNGVSFYVNGSNVPVIIPPQGTNSRAFTTDVDGINYVAIGRHESNVSVEYFSGILDEVQIFERELTQTDISYLYNLGKENYVLRAKLRAEVDAVGTVEMTEFGRGYKETPDINFTVSHYIENPATFPYFASPAGQAELNATFVEQIILTKDFDSSVNLILPDGREVLRMSTEYVLRDDNSNNTAVVPQGLYGYSSPPEIIVEGSPNYPDDNNATGYPLFFMDVNDSAEIYHSGVGYDLTTGFGFNNDAVRIFGPGYRPPTFEAKINSGRVDRLVLKQPGEGNYDWQPSSSDIVYIGDNRGEVDPQYIPGSDKEIFIEDEGEDTYRINTDKEDKKNDNLEVITGINLNDDPRKRGANWITPPTVFADWRDENWQGHVAVSNLEFNSSIKDINIIEKGFGYLTPVEVRVVDGRPSLSPAYEFLGNDQKNSFFDLNSSFRSPIIEVTTVDENGSITGLNLVDSGAGFEPSILPLNEFFGSVQIIVTGGGGRGAEIYGNVLPNGSLSNQFLIVNGGIGYYNLDSNNSPTASLIPADGRTIGTDEQNASIHLSLGGSLLKPEVSSIASVQFTIGEFIFEDTDEPNTDFRYAAPWVMILDKGRKEADINASQRAHAAAKVVDGNITKIIVTKGGEGYIDPHVVVCGTAPNYGQINEGVPGNAWQWRCTNLRETIDGQFLPCGHVDIGSSPYPPEVCPGEEVNAFRTDVEWDDNYTKWNDDHNKQNNHPFCPTDCNHRKNVFLSPICSGKKANFVLINDYYRAGNRGFHSDINSTYEDWLPFEVICSAISKDGQISEVVIDSHGSKYLHPEIVISGTGSGVEAIPVFNEEGIITEIIYNDPRIKNTELDKVYTPLGAGHGFLQKPWGKDFKYQPTYGVNETIRCQIYADIIFWDGTSGPEFEVYDSVNVLAGRVEVKDGYGDRISSFQILEKGVYAAGDFNITVDYNSSFIPDKDLDGETDFIEALASVETTNILTKFTLDHNGTFEKTNYLLDSGIRENVTRSTFLAEPDVKIFNELRGAQLSHFEDESNVSNIILGGFIDYDFDPDQSSLNIYADDSLPNEFYYGFQEPMGLLDRSSMGGKILVHDGMPGMNWGEENDWDNFTFTDENGSYALANLEPGLYNIAVLMEDENLQDLALRPDSDPTLYSRTLYVPGFTPVVLETDNRGKGRSRLVWSGSSRQEARFFWTDELKELGGLGGGFQGDSSAINLNIEPHPANTSFGIPNIQPQIEIDGTLSLFIIDDVNSSTFDPDDRFTVSYSSFISGIDFSDKYESTFLDNSFMGGTKQATNAKIENNQSLTLFLSPNSGSSSNAVEVVIAGSKTPSAFTTFSLTAYDSNGRPIDCSSAQWSLGLDFNVSDGNYSKIAVLNSPKYYKKGEGGTGYGYYFPLFMNSFYESNNSGIYNPVDFQSLPIFDHAHNFGMLKFYMSNAENNFHASSTLPAEHGFIKMPTEGNETNQVNLTLYSTLQGKGMTVTATLQGESVSTRIIASPRSSLTDYEKWLDQYFSTVKEGAILNGDEDNDSLVLSEEWSFLTNPLSADTDADGLTDDDEINNNSYPTNPRNSDTDGDGFLDSTELLPELLSIGFHPLLFNQSPPYPSIHPYNLNGPYITSDPSNPITIGAEANETSLTGNKVPLVVEIEGNFSQVVTQTTSGYIVNQNALPGTYHIIYKAVDSLKREVQLIHYLTIAERDTTAPVITLSGNGTTIIDKDGNLTVYVLVGEGFQPPSYLALDNKDGSLTNDVNVSGLENIDFNNSGTYEVTYSVTDSALNKKDLKLLVKVEEPAFVINGKAIDGYLSGSTVIFDSIVDGNFDGQHDLNRTITTDGTGSFVFRLTSSELEIFAGDNNILDPNEAKLIVSGGYDPTIESNFTGQYEADINSSIISPLTTLVSSLMSLDNNLSKEDAKSKVKLAFGLSVDPTNFDPLAKALENNESAREVLLANTRLANVLKQVDALTVDLSLGTFVSGQASNLFIKELALNMVSSNTNPLDDTTILTNAINESLTQIQPTADTSQVSNAVQIFQSSDNAIVQTGSSSISLTELAKELAKNQQAIEDAIINQYTDPIGPDISSLVSSVSKNQITNLSSLINEINVFPPIAHDFNITIRADKWSSGALASNISATDGDGDSLIYSIASSNFDMDADGISPFSISANGTVTIEDPDDLINQAGQTLKLSISVSDGKGMNTTCLGMLKIDNKLSLLGTPVEGKLGWTESWFGTIFSNGESWIYHPDHNWLTVIPDSNEGYWFWDSKMSIWWWTKVNIYPYFYRANYGWNYWKFNQGSRIFYDYQTKNWETP